ncbi:hypothetical protein FA15DRAFT_668625 [Coprinopsis marcescibilis]|uniref:Uncharacterized protein n=1 Tax=Coprinopsis marcescibilis TaxID=230819 RepID=A0A5C3KZJ0_COPMA|nr:hypothetical protein FA15DRAFT_668625 [Coprinopsis marcescibilis]
MLLSVTFANVGIEGVLTGAFIVLNMAALSLLLSRARTTIAGEDRKNVIPLSLRLRSILNTPLIPGSLILLFSAISHWIVTLIRAMQGVAIIDDGGSAADFFKDASQPTLSAMAVFTATSIAVADLLLVWRLWVVSNRCKWILIPPLALSVAFSVTMARVTVFFARASSDMTVFNEGIFNWMVATIVFTACINLYCSGLIVFYIWRINSASRPYTQTNMNPIVVIIIESGALHALWSMFSLVAYQTRSSLWCLAIDNAPAVSGIAFMLINVRVALGRDINPQSTASWNGSISSAVFKARHPHRRSQESADVSIRSCSTDLSTFTSISQTTISEPVTSETGLKKGQQHLPHPSSAAGARENSNFSMA